MSKRMKALIAVVAAILLLTVAGTATVIAQEEEPAPIPEANGLLARVADVLGISQEDLLNAFRQAQQDVRQEAFLRFLERAVEEGRISQEEAFDILEWWQQRPEAMGHLLPRALGFPSLGGRRMQQQGTLPMHGGPMWESPKGPRGWHSTAPPWLAE